MFKKKKTALKQNLITNNIILM